MVHNHIVEGGYIGKEISPRKLLYGSDSDHRRIKGDIQRWKAAFDKMGLTDDEQDQIFYRNAARISTACRTTSTLRSTPRWSR